MGSDEWLVFLGHHWPQAGKTLVIVVGIAAVAALIVFAIVEAVRSAQRREQQKEGALLQFYALAEQKEMEQYEIELLLNMLYNFGVTMVDEIFTSNLLFEQCVELEFERMQSHIKDESELQEQASLIERIREKLGYKNLPFEKALISTRGLGSGQLIRIRSLGNKEAKGSTATVINVDEMQMVTRLSQEDVILHKGDTVAVSLTRGGDAEYIFQTAVLNVRAEKPPLVYLQHTRQLQRKQLRNHVRLDVKVNLRFRVIGSKSQNRSSELQEGTILDVSGGGLSFRHTQMFMVGDLLSLNFDLGSSSLRGIGGKVLRISELPAKGDTPLYKHHIEFVNIQAPMREKIIRYIFEKQREENQWR